MPAILYVAIIEMAMPGEYFREDPASRNVIGMIEAEPNPTKQNPINVGQKVGKITANPIPRKINTALMK